MTELDLRGLLAALDEAEVELVVIGGVAVGAHGYVRATEDLDIVPDPDAENVRRLAAMLERLEATLPTSNGRRFRASRDEGPLHMGASLSLETRIGGLDIVQRIPGVPPYADLDGAAIESELLGVRVRICSLEHLRAMKAARGAKQDEADLKGLGPG